MFISEVYNKKDTFIIFYFSIKVLKPGNKSAIMDMEILTSIPLCLEKQGSNQEIIRNGIRRFKYFQRSGLYVEYYQ